MGQLLAVTQPGNRVTQLHYDKNGKAIGLTDPRENTTAQQKDDCGNTIRQSHPDTGTTYTPTIRQAIASKRPMPWVQDVQEQPRSPPTVTTRPTA
ncbi:MAG: hypothetical protein KZQ84_19865 [Candidatus Thiodiazotropha sp. (ex Lucinoma borealis)]|nr:hypothetical protein [Candidatus Thiodiazotropha sp. (ex Lucinoma borealis)]